jgi:hypothetical protein
MKRQNYYPSRTADQVTWLENFRNKLPGYTTALGLTAAQTTDAVADARWLVYILSSYLPATRAWAVACTAAAGQAQTGTGGPLVLPVFTPPVLQAGVASRDEGCLTRLFELIADLKSKPATTPAIRSDLRIVGPESAPPDYALLRPELTGTVTSGGVQIGWGWQGYTKFLDQLEIQVDRGTPAGWQILTFDTTPNYLDTSETPAALTAWRYRAIFRVDDAQVGLWSEILTVPVGG